MNRLNEAPGDARELADWITANGRRLVVIMIGELRSACQNALHLRRHLLDRCPHLLAVQCPVAEAAAAAEIFPGANVDGWNPGPLPAAVRHAWPVFGRSGEAARRSNVSFYYQLARQARAASVFEPFINPANDVVLKWRPDLQLFAPIVLLGVPDSAAVVVPLHDNYGGLNDQCALGHWPVMRRYLMRLERLRSYLWRGGHLHPETYLGWAMRGTNVRRMRIACAINRGATMNRVKISTAMGDTWDEASGGMLQSNGVPVVRDIAGDDALVKAASRGRLVGRLWQAVAALTLR